MYLNIDKYEEVFNMLKKYLKDNSTNPYNPTVTKMYKESIDRSKFPLVVLQEITNTQIDRTFGGNESVSDIVYEVNIFAINKIVNRVEMSNMTIARELSQLVDFVLGDNYKMTRIYCSPTPNIDETIYRITMRYEKEILDNRARFI